MNDAGRFLIVWSGCGIVVITLIRLLGAIVHRHHSASQNPERVLLWLDGDRVVRVFGEQFRLKIAPLGIVKRPCSVHHNKPAARDGEAHRTQFRPACA